MIKKCRICKGEKLVKVGDIGNVPISDFTPKPVKTKKYPLQLVYCPKCTLLQLAHNCPRDLMYKNYWYESGINKAIVEDLKSIAVHGRGVHIDIGCNDGTLLKHSKADKKIGVDPSNISPKYLGPNDEYINTYWEDARTSMAHVITAAGCLYDLPNPSSFMKNIKRHLHEDGVFISQFQSLAKMIELNDVGNICHEHLEYYSYKSLVYMFELSGLEIFKVEKNDMNGGSYRVFARHYKKGSININEKDYSLKDFKEFFNRMDESRKAFQKWAVDKNIVGYGASTKAGTMVAFFGFGPKVVVDVNPKKAGKFTNWGGSIVTKIPKNTEYLWVFPYGFLKYFQKKENKFKGKWVTTIPKFKVIK